jgi:hypothetical protein
MWVSLTRYAITTTRIIVEYVGIILILSEILLSFCLRIEVSAVDSRSSITLLSLSGCIRGAP